MTLTTPERLTVDGIDMKTLAKNVETLAATLRTPARRGANAVTAGRSGVIRTPGKMHEAPTYVWPMWVVGTDDDGRIPVGSTARQQFYNNIDVLTSLFDKDGVLDVQHTLPDGSVRQADCECVTAIDFSTFGTDPTGKFAVELQNLNAYWADLVDTVETMAVGTRTDLFSGVTAPLDDGVYEIVGPITNPSIYDLSKPASFIRYNAEIPAGQSISIDAAQWSLFGTGGLVPDLTKLVISGMGGRMLRLTPNDSRAYSVELAGAATTVDTQLTVTGRRKYLVG